MNNLIRRALPGAAAVLAVTCATVLAGAAPAQQPAGEKPAAKPESPQAEPKPGEIRNGATQSEIDKALGERLKQISAKKPADWTADELAERVAISYRGFNFSQLKKVYNTGREEGRISIVTTNGELGGTYVRRYVDGPKKENDRMRLDIIFETSPKPEQQLRYSLTYNGASVWAAQDGRYVSPDTAAATAFRASVLNDYTALFRWQEDGDTLARLPARTMQGLPFEVIEATRPDGTKIRFLISDKTFRVLHVEYDISLAEGQPPVTFRESYSDFKVVQEVLVPTKRKLRQNDQLVQTIEIANATYGVALDDSVFLQI